MRLDEVEGSNHYKEEGEVEGVEEHYLSEK